jgi:hypothetical protein
MAEAGLTKIMTLESAELAPKRARTKGGKPDEKIGRTDAFMGPRRATRGQPASRRISASVLAGTAVRSRVHNVFS